MLDIPLITGKTQILGVFGYPVEHSRSPIMHNAALAALKLPYIYVPFSVSPSELPAALQGVRAMGIVGVNLTIPHKEQALHLMDEVTEQARLVGGVNTVHCQDGRLIGDNTDSFGFFRPLEESGIVVRGRNVLVFGAGGAARSVVIRLLQEEASVFLVNRSRDRAESLANTIQSLGNIAVLDWEDVSGIGVAIESSALLVQTTRVGMHPDVEGIVPIPLAALHPDLLVYDLVYNPIKTRLLQEAERHGCRTLDGVKMLVYQGAASFQRWTGVMPPTEVMEQAVLQTL